MLVVEQPVFAYARMSIRYRLKKACQPDVSDDIVKATNMVACKLPDALVDDACIVKVRNRDAAPFLHFSLVDYAVHVEIKILIQF